MILLVPLVPLKTPEQLYEIYKDQCGCGHSLVDNHRPAHGATYCRYCTCKAYQPLTPMQISEEIEAYYETYEEHKKLVSS